MTDLTIITVDLNLPPRTCSPWYFRRLAYRQQALVYWKLDGKVVQSMPFARAQRLVRKELSQRDALIKRLRENKVYG